MPPTPISVRISKGPSRVPRSRATAQCINQQSAIPNQQCMVVPMGVLLTRIIVKQPLTLEELRGRTLAVDGHGELYQFLALIRLRDGTPLRDGAGRVTSHLSGLFYRTTRLIADYGLKPVFVFDGTPPPQKAAEIARRRDVRQRYEREHAAAI